MWNILTGLWRKLDRRLTKGVYQHGHEWSREPWSDEIARERREAKQMRDAVEKAEHAPDAAKERDS